MTFPAVVEACDGQFAASLVGVPNVRVGGSTCSQAIDALKEELEHRVARGELLSLDLETVGMSSMASWGLTSGRWVRRSITCSNLTPSCSASPARRIRPWWGMRAPRRPGPETFHESFALL